MKISLLFTLLLLPITLLAQDEGDYRALEISEVPLAYRYATKDSLQGQSVIHTSTDAKASKDRSDSDDKYVHTYNDFDVAITNLDNAYIVTRAPGDLVEYVMTRYGSMEWDSDGNLKIYNLAVQNANYFGHDITLPYPILPPNPTTTVEAVFNLSKYFHDDFVPSVVIFDSHGDSRIVKFNFVPSSANSTAAYLLDDKNIILGAVEFWLKKHGQLDTLEYIKNKKKYHPYLTGPKRRR